MPNIKVRITGESLSPAKMRVKGKKSEYIVDKEDASPLEYILTALAGCINIVGFMVAKEMDISIGRMHVGVEGKINTDKLAGKNVDGRTGYREIAATVTVESDASEADLENWLTKVEERCPVADNITSATPVKTSIGKK